MKSTKTQRIGHAPLLSIIVLLGFIAGGTSLADYMTRVGMDLALPFVSPPETQASDDVVMVVIDEVTHQSAPFSETPEVAWTPYLGRVIQAIADAGAASIGLDIIYPKTLSGPELLPGHDRPFLSALFNVGRQGKLILGETRLSDQVIAPYQGQVLAVGGEQNVSPLQLTPDGDGVVRSYPARLGLDDGGSVYSFANELIARAGKSPGEQALFVDYITPMTVAAYRLSDVLSCAIDARDVSAAFAGKIVLIGVALDVEDRHLAANRFVTDNQPMITNLACAQGSNVEADGATIQRQSVPGVTIHARAAQTLLNGRSPQVLSSAQSHIITALMLLVLGVLFLRIPPLWGFLFLVATLVAVWLAAIMMLTDLVILPYLFWAAAALLSYLLLYTYRVFFEDKEKRWIRHAFRHFLSPDLVDQLADDPSLLKLGGEQRQVAVLFLDLAGFTSATEKLADQPEALVAELNRYLGVMSDIIEEHNGFVDKFIGDAVMAIWGAPVPNAHAIDDAARAALACQAALAKMNTGRSKPFIKGMRIGLNAGEAVVGNMGSEHRFNYTAVGDSVNLAARLESANKTYGTAILAGEDFEAGLSPTFTRREVDYVTVVGRSTPVHIFEIMDEQAGRDSKTPQAAELEAFAGALAQYRAQNFATAGPEFAKLARQDDVAALYAKRCAVFQETPPPDDWDGRHDMVTK